MFHTQIATVRALLHLTTKVHLPSQVIKKLTGEDKEEDQQDEITLHYPVMVGKFTGTLHEIHKKIIEMSHNSLSSKPSVYFRNYYHVT